MPERPPGQADEPRAIIPFLDAIYPTLRDFSWLIIRLVIGGAMLTHGVAKLRGGSFVGFEHGLAHRGVEPAVLIAGLVYFNETIGSIMLMVGLLTRFVAASLAIELAYITFAIFFPHGWSWRNAGGGWEYLFVWGAVTFAVALRGGGPYSLDRLIGWEL